MREGSIRSRPDVVTGIVTIGKKFGFMTIVQAREP